MVAPRLPTSEARGHQGRMASRAPSPFLGWLYGVTSVQGASNVIGVIELICIMRQTLDCTPKTSAWAVRPKISLAT
jgi:hypothetical protein